MNRRFASLLTTSLAIVCAISVLAAGSGTPAEAATRPIMFGAVIDGTQWGYGNPPYDMRGVTRFEQESNKHVAIIPFGNSWEVSGKMTPFPTSGMETIRKHGSIPFYTWLSKGADISKFSNAAVISGKYDAYIHQFAKDAQAWGHPFFLRFDHEMDGDWYPWGEGHNEDGSVPNNNAPGSYARMWRHVHDIFAQEKAFSVTWVFTINHECKCGNKYAPLAQIWPGDTYVDWTAIDPYNRFTGEWLTFAQTLRGGAYNIGDTYDRLVALAPNHPMMLSEFASREKAGDKNGKANWLKDAYLTQIPNVFTHLQAVIYFDWSYDNDDLVTGSSPQALAAFKVAVAPSFYIGNVYGNLPAGRIHSVTVPN